MRTLEKSSSGIAAIGAKGAAGSGAARFIGIDAGAETLKFVELSREGDQLRVSRRRILEHGKNPGSLLLNSLREWNWDGASGGVITGRFATQVRLPRIPTKQAQVRGYKFLFGQEPATIVNIGSHGFSVLEIRSSGTAVFRENSRCSQGTGNFLRQLVERFSLTVEEASSLCANVALAAPLSGRCPVILKTDMTHLANKGEDRARILAGLFDAVCENVLVLIKPGVSPPRVLLTGGVSRSPRVARVFAESLAKMGMQLVSHSEEELLCLEALGAALLAAEEHPELPPIQELLLPPRRLNLEKLPALSESLPNVMRMPARPWTDAKAERAVPVERLLVLGLDIGSTGSKAVAIDNRSKEVLWEAYRQTLGDPVGAAQDLVRKFTTGPAGGCPVVAFGATGSGREVAGSLLTSCFGKESVFVVNEIVAHATGALHYDERVDTIFEIGGQDAKYIRLAEGRIIDCAMNEACSAGTGSFIEEQGRKFGGMEDVRQLGRAALSAEGGVSLGQHCSVFMAEVIDEAVAAGIDSPAIISGLYDSIIKNYLNRVKGNRSVGKVIFCQGMPFSADALAAAVARQTGSQVIVPPNPGTVGALGIALLAVREVQAVSPGAGLDLSRFLNASVLQKDSFVCRATAGCGGVGNKCRIERLRTLVQQEQSQFTWGGACALHDKATRKRKLPDLAPDPFREREELLQKLLEPCLARKTGSTIAITDEFMLKGLFPFFAAFFDHAGFRLKIVAGADQATLKRGIQQANVPFCAPMQLFHGLTDRMLEAGADWVFLPMLRSVPAPVGQRRSVVCPVVQAAPDLLRCTLKPPQVKIARERDTSSPPREEKERLRARLLTPILNFGQGGLESKEFLASCAQLAAALGLPETTWRGAWAKGTSTQKQFDRACAEMIERALEFCRERDITPVVVLGRNYTIYNKTLNSNVPAILREQGAIAIPVENYPVAERVPQFRDMYWGYGQSILRAAHQVRRTPGVYALYCSNYSCGPDSFNLHFAAYIMEGKPFAVIETDGHSGDAGTKTRVEAFLHCVDEDRRSRDRGRDTAPCIQNLPPPGPILNDFAAVQSHGLRLSGIGRHNGSTEHMLVPYLSGASDAVAAVFRGLGLAAEALPSPDAESLRLGRRYTSGKECLPMPLTLGSLLQRLERAAPNEHFVYVMPSTDGPCRFGVYNLLNQIVLDRLGWRDRLRIWSPKDSGYFDDLPAGTEMLMLSGIMATDLLLRALLDVRPTEQVLGRAQELYETCMTRLRGTLEAAGRGDLRLAPALWQVANGKLFGISEFLGTAGVEFAALRGSADLPLVEMTGEIYVRAVDFSNDYLIRKLEERELRVRPASQSEWLAYCSYVRRRRTERNRFVDSFSEHVQHKIEAILFNAMARHMGWPVPASIEDSLSAAAPYVNAALEGEAVLTVGGCLEGWRRQEIDAAVAVGPLECMPTKIAEAQFHHVAEHDGLLTLTLSFNGDPISTTALDNFAFEVHERFRKKREQKQTPIAPAGSRQPLVTAQHQSPWRSTRSG